MSKFTGILDPEIGDAQVPSFDSVLSWSAELNFPELESLVRAIERITQDAGDTEVASTVLITLRNLRALADMAERDKVVLSGVETISFHILVLLAHYPPDKFKRTFLHAMRAINEPDPASVTPQEARQWLSESSAVYLYDTRLISQIREMVEHEADGVTISTALRKLIPVPGSKSLDRTNVPWRDDTDRLQSMDTALHKWHLTLHFDREPMPLGTAGGLMWALGEALESVDGVVANLDHLATGSVWAGIRLYASSIWRLDDVLQIMERTFDKVSQRLNPTANTVVASTPADRVDAAKSSSEISEHEKLSLEIELQIKRAELALLKLQHLEKVSDLLADRILEVDSVEFHFENYPIFVVEERKVVHREPLKRLRDQEIKSPGSSGQGEADVQL